MSKSLQQADNWASFRHMIRALISGLEDITERIERAAAWTIANGPLQPDEEATVKLMIECQIARGMDGDGRSYSSADDDHRGPL